MTLERPQTPTAVMPIASMDDPRVIQILSTEHWSLLGARSLAYNEAFVRASGLAIWIGLAGRVIVLSGIFALTGWQIYREHARFVALFPWPSADPVPDPQ